MSACANVTERDVVLRERAAFLNGVWQAHIDRLVCEDKHRTVGLYEWDPECGKALLNTNGAAQTHYPLLVTRPRVWTDSDGYQFRVIDGAVEWRSKPGETWLSEGTEYVARYRAMADLLANPNETVPEDA